MTYDLTATGERLRAKREALGLSRHYVAEHINRAEKYYADIERGYCGMSIETLLELAALMQLSVDYILFGDPEAESDRGDEAIQSMLILMQNCSDEERRKLLSLAKVVLEK